MSARKTLIAGAFLLGGAALVPFLAQTSQAQPIDADPAYQPPQEQYGQPYGQYQPAPDPTGNRSGLPRVAGLRGSFAFSGGVTPFVPTTPPSTLHAGLGYGGGGSVYLGQRLPFGLRLDLEGMYKYLPVNKLTPQGAGTTAASGSVQMAAPMVNLMWEMPVDYDLPFLPFVGVGGGAAYVWNDVKDSVGTRLSHESHWSPAYSVMVGAAMPLSDSSRVSAMYRWMRLTDVGFRCTNNAICKTGLSNSSVDLSFEMDM